MFKKIKTKFLEANLNIINMDKLDEYINFCLNTKTTGDKTSLHHILPKADNLPFKKYSNLKQNKFNAARLTFANHYRAHYILAQAIEHVSVLSSFCAMNNKDLVNKRLTEDELIGADEYEKMLLKSKELFIEWGKIIGEDGLSNSERQARNAALTKANDIDDNGLNEHNRSALRAAETKKNTINEDGLNTFQVTRNKIVQENKNNIDKNGDDKNRRTVLKAIDTMRNTTIDGKTLLTVKSLKGQETLRNTLNDKGETLMEVKARKISEARTKKGKFYNIMKDGKIFMENVPAKEARKMAANLPSATRENYIGKSKMGATTMRNKGKPEYIGLYSEEI